LEGEKRQDALLKTPHNSVGGATWILTTYLKLMTIINLYGALN
jgi:hypothetical protein